MVTASPVAESVGLHNNVLARSPTVFVVDPDPVTSNTIKDLFHGYELTVQAYATGREFLAAYTRDRPGCVVLEHRICDIGGLQIQRRLTQWDQCLPMVFVTSGMDVSTAVALSARRGDPRLGEAPASPSSYLTPFRKPWPLTRTIATKRPAGVGQKK